MTRLAFFAVRIPTVIIGLLTATVGTDIFWAAIDGPMWSIG